MAEERSWKFMEQEGTFQDDSLAPLRKGVRMAILTQLTQVAATVPHIDELFRWIAHATVHRFGARAAQVWANQTYTSGKTMLELRTNVYSDLTSAASLISNQQVADVANRILQEQCPLAFHSVDGAFSSHQSLLLKRHGINYFVGYFLGGELWLPPAQMASMYSAQKVPTLLKMTVLLFLRSVPAANALPMLRQIVEQVPSIAQNSGLLLSTPPYGTAPFSDIVSSSSSASPEEMQEPTLATLIPCRVEDIAYNPLADPLLISNKPVRSFYAAIDDSRTVEEICLLSHLSKIDAYRILQILLEQRRIRLYTTDGRFVKNSILTNDL